ncbi:hypothetical protein LCGC14_2973100 [marine sediment metagenome]|uniref:Uncharacterized protein n=1 Tax=marine sediment metagenome TaxID=412755 RepID=A0A0F8XW99_9ZZZZ
MNLKSLENRFFNLLDELQVYENKKAKISLSIQLRGIVEEWLISDELWNLKDLVNETKMKHLEQILETYPDLLTDEKGINEQIIKAFTFERPLTSIELINKNSERVLQFMEELKEFFLVGHAHYEIESDIDIFISRSKTVFDTTMYHVSKNLEQNGGFLSRGFFDKIADLLGIFFGYSPLEVVRHCLKELPKKYDLII